MERLIKVGKVEMKSAKNIKNSRLGIGFEKLDRNVFDPEKAYDKVAELGVKWVRIQSGWARCEKQKGVYDFSWLDSIVDNLVSRGLCPWLNLVYGNEIYTDFAKQYFGNVGCPPIGSKEELDAWCKYVYETVKHFKGRIEYYEIWNEPDLKYSWKHSNPEGVEEKGPDAKEYAAFAIATAKAIHAADENAKALGFAIGHPSDTTFINSALAAGLGEHIDGISFHIYAADDLRRPELITKIKTLSHMYNPKLEIVQGEAGAQSRSDGAGAMRGFAWTQEKQRKYLLRGTLHDLASDVKFTSYFTTVDMIEALRGLVAEKSSYLDYGYFGVLSAEFDEDGRSTGNYSPKLSYYALGTLASIFCEEYKAVNLPMFNFVQPSKRINGFDNSDLTLCEYGFTKPNGSWGFAYWNSVPLLTSTYEGTISFKSYGCSGDKIQIVDLRDGTIYKLPDSMVTFANDNEIILNNIPLLDSPLLLTFGDFI